MQITRLKLENFGPHESLDWATGGGVIGVTGNNGSGKTHLLLAIEYAITGDLPETKKSYVFEGKKSGFVEIWFSHNNRNGRIKRWLNSSKREMDWDGESFTKASEVDEAIDDLLGARKDSFRNSSFIRQGELKGVLDGTDTQRRNILIKLLSLGFVEKRKNQVERKIKEYEEKNLDDTVYGRRDQLLEQEREAEEKRKSDQKKLDGLRFYKADIESIQTHLEAVNRLAEEKENLSVFEERRKMLNSGDLRDYDKAKENYEKLQKECSNARSLLTDAQTKLSDINDLEHAVKECEDARKRVSEKETNLEAELADLHSLNPGSESPDNVPGDLSKKTNDATLAVNLKPILENKRKKRDEIHGSIPKVKKDKEGAQNRLSKVKDELNDSASQKRLSEIGFKSMREAFEDVKKSECSGNKVTCQKCNLQVLDPSDINEESLARAEKVYYDWKKKFEADKEKFETISNEVSSLSEKLADFEKDLSRIDNELGNLEKQWAGVDVAVRETTSGQLDELAERRDKANAIASRVAQLRSVIRSEKQNADQRENEEKRIREKFGNNVPDTKQLREIVDREKSRIESFDKTLEELDQTIKRTEPTKKSADDLDNRISILRNERIPEYHEKVNEFEQSENVEHLLSSLNTNDFKVVYDHMIAAQEEYNEIQFAVKSHRDAAHQAREQRNKLETVIRRQENYKRVLERLRKLRDMLSPDGVVKSYLVYRFQKLLNTVSKNLDFLDANFVIRPCNEELSYEFLNTDKTDATWLSIRKLSGGQKVKLGIAFLISVQETICKDVNFLVLDEPSTHLDENSVESLNNLFSELASKLINDGGQFWIVDHHFSLQNAITHHFHLSSKTKTNDSL